MGFGDVEVCGAGVSVEESRGVEVCGGDGWGAGVSGAGACGGHVSGGEVCGGKEESGWGAGGFDEWAGRGGVGVGWLGLGWGRSRRHAAVAAVAVSNAAARVAGSQPVWRPSRVTAQVARAAGTRRRSGPEGVVGSESGGSGGSRRTSRSRGALLSLPSFPRLVAVDTGARFPLSRASATASCRVGRLVLRMCAPCLDGSVPARSDPGALGQRLTSSRSRARRDSPMPSISRN